MLTTNAAGDVHSDITSKEGHQPEGLEGQPGGRAVLQVLDQYCLGHNILTTPAAGNVHPDITSQEGHQPEGLEGQLGEGRAVLQVLDVLDVSKINIALFISNGNNTEGFFFREK